MLADDVRNFLHRHKVRLAKDLGQHFLIDDAVLSEILQTSALSSGDRVLEIGPGIGVLTRELLKAGAKVTAVELDRRMIPLLQQFTNQSPKSPVLTADRPFGPEGLRASNGCPLIAIEGNALHVPLPMNPPFTVVANIPYAITSPLLRRLLLELPTPPTSLTLLIQREVAETICAPTTEGILTVLVKLCGTPRLIRRVPRDAFLPPPEVESAVIKIDCHPQPLVDRAEITSILHLVKHAMSGRRKMLRNTIGSLPGGMEALAAAMIDPERRPQTMTVEEWVGLEKILRSGIERYEHHERIPRKPRSPTIRPRAHGREGSPTKIYCSSVSSDSSVSSESFL